MVAALAVGTALVVAATPAAAAEKVVTGGTLDWGVRASFRSYITGPIAHGSITAAAGATTNGDGTFRFPGGSGGHYDTTSGELNAAFAGSVHFTGHEGQLDMVLSDVRLEIDGATGVLRADVVSKSLSGSGTEPYPDIELADLDLTGITPTAVSGGMRWTAVPATLTEAGVPAFSDFYPAGSPLDPLTFTLSLADPPGPPGDSAYVGITPTRLLDSRNGTGGISGPWQSGQTRDLAVRGGTTTVPQTATAVVINLTGVFPSTTTHVTAWPAGEAMPVASSLNLFPGTARPNLVTVKVGSYGKISLFNHAGTVDLLVDVVGYYEPVSQAGGAGVAGVEPSVVSGGRFNGITPKRVLDSRFGNGTTASPWGAGETRNVLVRGGTTTVPASATAVAINVTVTGATAASHVTVFPAGEPMPLASNLNVDAGQTVPNLVVVKVGTNGNIGVFNNSGSADIIGDIVGYYDDGGSLFAPMAPLRVLDSRNGTGGYNTAWPAATTRPVTITGSKVPNEATAVVLNITGVFPTAGTHITVYPGGESMPLASNLNLSPNDIRANLVIVTLGPGGIVNLFNNAGSTNLVADVVGYFTPEADP